MKILNKVLIVTLAGAFVFGLSGSIAAHAATSPSLGTADSFSILAGTPNITDAGGASAITGNVGLSPATGAGIGLLSSQVTGTIYSVDAAGPAGSVVNPGLLTTAKNDLTTAYTNLASDACGDGTAGGNGSDGPGPVPGIDWGGGSIDLAGRNLVPGVYCAGAFTLSGTLTLSGGASSVYIFRSAATIITSPGSSVTGGGACNVWWRAVSSVTLDTTTAFKGNILALTSITMNTGATLAGRALARNGAVTLDHNTITNAACATPATPATLRVIKTVTNDVDGTSVAADFNLYVKLSGSNVTGSPAVGIASPGRSYTLDPGTYVVSEDADDGYNQSFSGACNSSGSVTLASGESKTCTITNNDISPTIRVTKEASKTTLLSGPEDVTFTYKVTNRGDVALSDVSVKDDKCDSVKYASGDDNNDDLLDTSEEWIYRCTDKIEKTETNTVTALGTANGERVKDTDKAKVTVSTPGLPNAGIGPADENSAPWNVMLPIGTLVALVSFYIARKKLAI